VGRTTGDALIVHRVAEIADPLRRVADGEEIV